MFASTNTHFFKDKDGKTIGIEGVARDITELKSAEKALKESEKKHRHLIETAMVGIYRTRIEDGKILAANQKLAEMMGYSSVDRFVEEYVTSTNYTDPNRRKELLNQIQIQGKVEDFEVEMMRSDGSTFQIALSATAYPDKGYLEGAVVDITKSKLAAKKLRDLNETMDLAQKMAGIGYWNFDIKTGKRIWSSQMFTVFGCDPRLGPPKNTDLKKNWHPVDWDVYQKSFQKAIEGKPYNIEVRVKFPDGQIHLIDTQGYPRYDDTGPGPANIRRCSPSKPFNDSVQH